MTPWFSFNGAQVRGRPWDLFDFSFIFSHKQRLVRENEPFEKRRHLITGQLEVLCGRGGCQKDNAGDALFVLLQNVTLFRRFGVSVTLRIIS